MKSKNFRYLLLIFNLLFVYSVLKAQDLNFNAVGDIVSVNEGTIKLSLVSESGKSETKVLTNPLGRKANFMLSLDHKYVCYLNKKLSTAGGVAKYFIEAAYVEIATDRSNSIHLAVDKTMKSQLGSRILYIKENIAIIPEYRTNHDAGANYNFYQLDFSANRISKYLSLEQINPSISDQFLICPEGLRNGISYKSLFEQYGNKFCNGYNFIALGNYFVTASSAGQITFYDLKNKRVAKKIELELPADCPSTDFIRSELSLKNNNKEIVYFLEGSNWSFNSVYQLENNQYISRDYLSPLMFSLQPVTYDTEKKSDNTLWFMSNNLSLKEVLIPDFPDCSFGYNCHYFPYDNPKQRMHFENNKAGFDKWMKEFKRINAERKKRIEQHWQDRSVLFTFPQNTQSILDSKPENAVPWQIRQNIKFYDDFPKQFRENYGKEAYKSGEAKQWLYAMQAHIINQNDSIQIRNSSIKNAFSEYGKSIDIYSKRDVRSEKLFSFKDAKSVQRDSNNDDQLIVNYNDGTKEIYSISKKKLVSSTVKTDF